MSEGLSEESGGHRPGSLGGMERDEWCQQTEPGFKGNGKKEESSLPPGYSCGGGGRGGGLSWNRGFRGHWKSSGMRAAVGAGVREDRSSLAVQLWEEVQRCPYWSRLALPHCGCSVLMCSFGGLWNKL